MEGTVSTQYERTVFNDYSNNYGQSPWFSNYSGAIHDLGGGMQIDANNLETHVGAFGFTQSVTTNRSDGKVNDWFVGFDPSVSVFAVFVGFDLNFRIGFSKR